MTNTTTVHLYTDGACKGNPGPGGWGVLLRYGRHEKELCGGEADTTNNRMELTAVIRGLEALNRPCQVTVHTDSQYVKNAELWQQLDQQVARHQVSWQWVKGHAGHPENERADQLANQGAANISNEQQ